MGRLTGNTSSRRTIFHQHTRIHKDTSRVVATAAATNCYIHFFCTKTSTLVVCLCDYVCVCVCRMGNSRRSFPWVSGADRTSSARGSYLTTSRMEKRAGLVGGGEGRGGLHAATHKISTPRAENTMMCTLAASHKLQMIRGGWMDRWMDAATAIRRAVGGSRRKPDRSTSWCRDPAPAWNPCRNMYMWIFCCVIRVFADTHLQPPCLYF